MTKEISIENLESDISCEDLRECFEHFGTVRAIELDPEKGMAHISFEKQEDAILAFKTIEGIDFLGRELRVSWRENRNKKSFKKAS